MLTPKAEERLQISTVPVERKAVPRTRTVGGIVTIRDGARLLVSAPLTGTLLAPTDDAVPAAGQTVRSAQTVFQLLPLLSPEREVPTAAERVAMASAQASLVSSRIIADGDAGQAEARVEAAGVALARAKKLLSDNAGSQRDVDEAQARLDIARTGLDAAQSRKELLDKLTLEIDPRQLKAVPVSAPQNGLLRAVSASVDQTVVAGAPLFEVVSLKTMWVRVPVYSSLRDQLDHSQAALVRDLGKAAADVSVDPVAAPPSADPLAATVDLFYELPNADGRFKPGERVEITLPLTGEEESLVIPRAAILRDIHGVAWVYVNSGEHTFERRRVEIQFTTEDFSVLSRGPNVGTEIVVDGAAELFGTEFGAGK